jgi:hypothetical protein
MGGVLYVEIGDLNDKKRIGVDLACGDDKCWRWCRCACFKNRLWERLAVNIGIALVFAAFYFRFFKNP